MNTRRGVYPANICEVFEDTYEIELLDGFKIGLGMGRVSPDMFVKIGASVYLLHKNTSYLLIIYLLNLLFN